MKVMLKFPVTLESQAADNAHNGGRIGAQPLGERADAQQNVVAGMLENGPDDFLALDGEFVDAFAQVRARCWWTRFHRARELFKFTALSRTD